MRMVTMLAGAAAALAGCGDARPLGVDGAWVRLPAVPGNPGAAYFTVHGGPRPVVLRGVSTDAAARAEMHRSMVADPATRGMAMEPIAAVAVAPHAEIAFAPGGRHVMLFGMRPELRAGSTAKLTFDFSGTRIAADARVIAAGDPAPR